MSAKTHDADLIEYDLSPHHAGAKTKGLLFIIDDDLGMQSLLCDVLKSSGYRVMIFSEALSALDTLVKAGSRVDTIICDLNMPKMNGLEFLDAVKKSYPCIPVILITAFGTSKVTQEALQKGAFGYLSKPFQLMELDRLIKKALAHKG